MGGVEAGEVSMGAKEEGQMSLAQLWVTPAQGKCRAVSQERCLVSQAKRGQTGHKTG